MFFFEKRTKKLNQLSRNSHLERADSTNSAQITSWNSATPNSIIFLTRCVRKICNLLP